MATDWMWVWENPKEAAEYIDQLKERVKEADEERKRNYITEYYRDRANSGLAALSR